MDDRRKLLKKQYFWHRVNKVSICLFYFAPLMALYSELRKYNSGLSVGGSAYYLYYGWYLSFSIFYYWLAVKKLKKEEDEMTVDILRCD